MILSRRHLMVTLGLALPAAVVIAAPANATNAPTGHKKHKPRHGGSTQASHKHHKTTTTPQATRA